MANAMKEKTPVGRETNLGTLRFQGKTRAALVHDKHVEVLAHADVVEYLASGEAGAASHEVTARLALEDVDWAPLITARHKIFCLGHNYLSHINEMDRPTPQYPAIFAKFSEALIGANDDIVLPDFATTTDWEAELAVVIGRTVRDVDIAGATAAIAGFTVLNDISVREYQHRTTQYLQGKTFEGSTPIGPVLVPGESCGWAEDLRIQCRVDGETVQDASTKDQLFKPAEVVSYLSSFITLQPGDVLAMGTPSGVGVGRRPQRFLREGQVVETRIEGLGALKNRVHFVPANDRTCRPQDAAAGPANPVGTRT
jgi:acylpyruvate hydrolase